MIRINNLMDTATDGTTGTTGTGTTDATTSTTESKQATATATSNAETKPATTAPESTTETKPETKAPETTQAPEKYELKLADGALSDAFTVRKVEEIARTNKWTNEQAQAFLDNAESNVKEGRDIRSREWTQLWHSDPELGGVNINKTLANVDRYRQARPEMATLLEKTGYLNNPTVIKELSYLGALMAEDKPLTATGQSAPAKPGEYWDSFYKTKPS